MVKATTNARKGAMSASIDDRSRGLLESKNFCHVGTIRKDGTPHVVPVWVDVENDEVLLNTAEGRAWIANADRDPRVTLTVQNLENPYEYVEIRGRVSERTNAGADEHINALAKKYLGVDEYPYRQPGEVRVKVRVSPERVKFNG
jgi:PPOX class probable F420-dependent enzyme